MLFLSVADLYQLGFEKFILRLEIIFAESIIGRFDHFKSGLVNYDLYRSLILFFCKRYMGMIYHWIYQWILVMFAREADIIEKRVL